MAQTGVKTAVSIRCRCRTDTIDNTKKSMTIREAMIQAQVELGEDREEAERLARRSEAILPDDSLPGEGPVEPGCERAWIEQMKEIILAADSDPESAQAYISAKLANQAKLN